MKPDQSHPRRFKDGILRPGDIVLTTTPGKLSAHIQEQIGADISHAMVCVADSSLMDSTSEGVHARNVQRLVVEPGCAVHALRLARPVSVAELKAVTDYARQQTGTRYTNAGAVQSVLKVGKVGRKQFCSRFVAQAYKAAGIDLVADADFCHPGELLKSKALVEIGDALQMATPEEVEAWLQHEDRTKKMRNATNTLLDGARKLEPTIETLNDIDDYLKRNPLADTAMSQLLQDSGYLDVGRGEELRNPWQYDLTRMDALPPEQMQPYCLGVMQDEQTGPNRYVVNRGGYKLWHAQHGLTYFGLMLDLYARMAEQHHHRVLTAKHWLTQHGVMDIPPTPPVRPHTPDWFKSYSTWDPVQASIAQMSVTTAGNPDVCTVCADDPASDYVLVDPPPGGPGTIRLCDFCHRLRQSTEPMTPFPV